VILAPVRGHPIRTFRTRRHWRKIFFPGEASMKVFITGGGGFLGYRLALRLLERKTLAGLTGSPHPFPGSNS
jgi:hypothetical protein